MFVSPVYPLVIEVLSMERQFTPLGVCRQQGAVPLTSPGPYHEAPSPTLYDCSTHSDLTAHVNGRDPDTQPVHGSAGVFMDALRMRLLGEPVSDSYAYSHAP